MTRSVLFCLVVILAGCHMPAGLADRGDAMVLPAAFNDRSCRGVAEQRVADADANGFDEDIQARVARDSYQACMASEQNQILGPVP